MVVKVAMFQLWKMFSDEGMAVLLLHHLSIPKAIAENVNSNNFSVIQRREHGHS